MAWYDGLKPDTYLSVSEWADQFRILSSKSAAEPGRWRTARTPYLKEIMDNLSPHSQAQRIIFKKGAQIGGTECGNNWIGFIIQNAPGPMMAVSPTVDMAKRNSRQRIEPLIEDSPTLKSLVAPARSRDSGNTVLAKEFPGGILVMTGANSAVGLRSMPARYLFMDEIDGYPRDVEGEGDPIILAERRSATFQKRRKILLVSTPTLKGLSSIDREFDLSDQRYYHVPCPFCDHFQVLTWGGIRSTDDGVFFECCGCGELIAEHHKTEMLARGRWVASAPGDGVTIGYHLSSLYSPIGWFSWADAVAMYEKAKKDNTLMQGFVNTVLGEVFEEEFDAPSWQHLYESREPYAIGTIPRDGLFLTAGVDIQKDRIECEIVAWGRFKQSWSVDYVILQGDTAKQEVWHKLTDLLNKDYLHESGITMPIRVLAIDSGYATSDVYAWARQFPQATWGANGARAHSERTVVAVKGQDRDTALVLSVSKADVGSKRRGLKVWNVSGPVAKMELYRWLGARKNAETLETGLENMHGLCHFPEYPEEYFKQLTSERRVVKVVRGYPKAVWTKDPATRNEALDCRVYARCAASIYGLDRFGDKNWEEFEKSIPDAPSQLVKTVETVDARFAPRTVSKMDDPYL